MDRTHGADGADWTDGCNRTDRVGWTPNSDCANREDGTDGILGSNGCNRVHRSNRSNRSNRSDRILGSDRRDGKYGLDRSNGSNRTHWTHGCTRADWVNGEHWADWGDRRDWSVLRRSNRERADRNRASGSDGGNWTPRVAGTDWQLRICGRNGLSRRPRTQRTDGSYAHRRDRVDREHWIDGTIWTDPDLDRDDRIHGPNRSDGSDGTHRTVPRVDRSNWAHGSNGEDRSNGTHRSHRSGPHWHDGADWTLPDARPQLTSPVFEYERVYGPRSVPYGHLSNH